MFDNCGSIERCLSSSPEPRQSTGWRAPPDHATVISRIPIETPAKPDYVGKIPGCRILFQTAPLAIDNKEAPMKRLRPLGVVMAMAIVLSTLAGLSQAYVGLPAPTDASGDAFPSQKHYSPYAGRDFPTQVFWGDTHLHTGMSFDAGAFGARLGPEDAYRFARGEELTSSTGLRVKLGRPLDFLVVADHSDNMGFFPRLNAGEPDMLSDPTGKKWYDMVQAGGQVAVQAAVEIITAFSQGTFPKKLESLPGSSAYRSAWEKTIDAARIFNDPGRFTAFNGYEWTSNTGGNNLHRVVIFRDGAEQARMVEPYTTIAPLGSDNPRELWKWMQRYEDKTGGRVLAIAHNGNFPTASCSLSSSPSPENRWTWNTSRRGPCGSPSTR
jgi:hypothetical protein